MTCPAERGVRASRNFAPTTIVCATAAAGLAAALWLAPFAGWWLAAVVVFLFPIPVALGLAIGFVSPRNTILGAPTYATIASAILIFILTGSFGVANTLVVTREFIMNAAALVIAFASAVVGRKAFKNGWAWRAALATMSACALLVLVGCLAAEQRSCSYQRTMLPQVLLEVDKNYIVLDKDPAWRFERAWELACYQISRNVGGRPMMIYASTDSPKVLGIRYEISRTGQQINDIASAQAYLRMLGFRERLIASLARDEQRLGRWTGGLGLIRLTLSTDGAVVLEPFPPFGARQTH